MATKARSSPDQSQIPVASLQSGRMRISQSCRGDTLFKTCCLERHLTRHQQSIRQSITGISILNSTKSGRYSPSRLTVSTSLHTPTQNASSPPHAHPTSDCNPNPNPNGFHQPRPEPTHYRRHNHHNRSPSHLHRRLDAPPHHRLYTGHADLILL